MSDIVLDSNVLLGLADEKDKWHLPARDIQRAIQHRGWSILYLDCVFAEAVSALARRLEEKRRSQEFSDLLVKLQAIMPDDQITWVYPSARRLFTQTLELMNLHQGRLNFHDALIALAAREMNIPYIASFDRDFDEIGWLTRIGQVSDVARATFPHQDEPMVT